MAGLQRFITYLYKYENDVKQENTGFAKVEFRSGSGRMEVHVRNLNLENPGCMVYLFARNGEIMQGVPMGEIQIRHGNGDVRYIFDEKNLNAFGISMNQTEGIFIPVSQGQYIASQWKEGEIREKNFHIMKKKENIQKQGAVYRGKETGEKEGLQEAGKSGAPEKKSYAKEDTSEGEMLKGETSQGEAPEEETSQGETPQEETLQGETLKEETPEKEASKGEAENLKATEIPMEKFAEDDSLERVFHKLRLKLTVFFPFLGESIECVKIDITDLSELPKKYWYLGKNSFLLHGFFNYRHLIMGEIREKGKSEYFIGVPGVFQNQERIMASMFGFPEFRTAEQTQYKTGNFGYWYRVM